MTQTFCRLLVPAFIIVACGNDTIAPPEETPGVESNVPPDSARGSRRPKPADATSSTSTRVVHGLTGRAPTSPGADRNADSNGATEPNAEESWPGDETGEAEVLELPLNWTPALLGPNGATAWYFASSADYQVNEQGATWLDRQGNDQNLRQPTAWAQPQLVPTGWAETQALRFNGSNLLRHDNWSVAPIGTNAPFAVFAVMRSLEPQHAGIAAWWSEWGDGVWASVRSTSELTLLDYHRLDDATHTQMYAGNQDLGTGGHIVAWRYSATTQSVTLMVDGAPALSTPQPPVGDITPMALIVGALSPLPTGFFDGYIYELVIVGGEVSDVDVQYFTEYAQAAWSGVLASPGSGPCTKADGQPSPATIRCDDGNSDTVGDHCSAGSCVGDVPRPGSPKELSPTAWYYAAESEVVITYDGVSTWFDRSPEHRDLMNGYWGRPAFVVEGWNGDKSTVTFTPSNALKRPGWTGPPTGTESAFTVLAVLRSDDSSQTSGVVSWFHPTGYSQVAAKLKPSGSASALDLYRLDSFLNTQEYLGNIDLGTTRHAVAWRYQDGVIKLTVDGFTQAEQRPPIGGIYSDVWFLMGVASGFPTGPFRGDISELAVIPRSITDHEVARFNEYALAEWQGFTICTPNCAGQPSGAANGCGGVCDGPSGPPRGESAGRVPPSLPRLAPYTGPIAGDDEGATAFLDEIEANLSPSELEILKSGEPLVLAAELQAPPEFTIRVTRFACDINSSCADCDLPCGPFGYECQLVTPEHFDVFINGEFAERIGMGQLSCPENWPLNRELTAPVDPLQPTVDVRVEAVGIMAAEGVVTIDNQNGPPGETCVVLDYVGDLCFEVLQTAGSPPPPPLPYETRLCANWNASYVDGDRGEDDRGIPAPDGAPFKRYPASYARFHLLTVGPAANPQLQHGYLDSAGCTAVDPARLTFRPAAEPEASGSLRLELVLETDDHSTYGPGFLRPDDEFEEDDDEYGMAYSIEAHGAWLGRAAFGTAVPGSVPFETWTQVGTWAQPPEVVQLAMPPTYMNPMQNIAATVSALLATPDLGIPTGRWSISHGTGDWFNDAFGNFVFESSGGPIARFAPPQPAHRLDECSLSDPCPDTMQNCIDLVTRGMCAAETGCGCFPSIFEATIPNTMCTSNAQCPDPATQTCLHDPAALAAALGRFCVGESCLLKPCNGEQNCRCMATCQTDADCPLPDEGCFDATRETDPDPTYLGPCRGNGPCLCMPGDNTRWKMILAHEIGHQIQGHAIGPGDLGASYEFCSGGRCINDPPGIATESPLCSCNHVRASNAVHCLQSIERTGGAQREGFAQFFAARVWNDNSESDCSFVYYKEFLDDTCVADPQDPLGSCPDIPTGGAVLRSPPLRVDCAAPQKWRNRHCNAAEYADMTTELDWLGFLYNLNVLAPEATRVPMTDIWKIYRNTCVPPGTPPNPDPPPCTVDIPFHWRLTGVPAEPAVACTPGVTTCPSARPSCLDASPGSTLPCPGGGACECKVIRQGFVEGTAGTYPAVPMDPMKDAVNAAFRQRVDFLGGTFGVSHDLTP